MAAEEEREKRDRRERLLNGILPTWYFVFGSKPQYARDVLKWAADGARAQILRDMLAELAEARCFEEITPVSLGRALRKLKDDDLLNHVLRADVDRKGVMCWRVEPVAPPIEALTEGVS